MTYCVELPLPAETSEDGNNEPYRKRDAYADAGPGGQPLVRTLRLSEISQHVLRVSCTRCGRIVDIHKADALRLYGPRATEGRRAEAAR